MGILDEEFSLYCFYLSILSRQGTVEEKATVSLSANVPITVEVTYLCSDPPEAEPKEKDLSQPALMRGLVSSGSQSRWNSSS